MSTRLTTKGQVTVPKRIRDALHLKPGSYVEFAINRDGQVMLRPLASLRRGAVGKFAAARGTADIKWRTDDLMALLRDG